MLLQELRDSSLNLLFPKDCQNCHAPLFSQQEALCATCESSVSWIQAPHCIGCGRTLKTDALKCADCFLKVFHFDRAFACTPYEGAMKNLLHAYKFSERKSLKNYLVKLMQNFINITFEKDAFEAILSVPLDKNKQRQRGFNQSFLLAAGLAKELGLPEVSKCLSRLESSSPQALLGKKDRKLNVQDHFLTACPLLFYAKKLLLIDDILTTGETVSECARVLKKAGASSVTVLACARGVR